MHVNTYLHFKGNCAEAFAFYEAAAGGKVVMSQTFGDSPMEAPAGMKDKIVHARIRIGDTIVMGSDAPAERYTPPQGFALALGVDSVEAAETCFARLSEGGQVQMPLAESFFAHRFGMLVDKFGIGWMISFEKAR